MSRPRVVWVTHWTPNGVPAFGSPHRCGTATYAEHILSHLEDDIEVTLRPFGSGPNDLAGLGFDILHLNFAEGRDREQWVPYLRSTSVKKVLTLHNAMPTGNKCAFTDLFDAVIVNQRVQAEAPNFRYIPQGILEAPPRTRPDNRFRVGTHGWPIHYKMIPEICHAAVLAGVEELLFLMSESTHTNIPACRNVYLSILQDRVALTLDSSWLTPRAVVERLQDCSIAVSAMSILKGGQSASVMSAIAARIPVVVNDNWMFADIKEHVYVADFNNPQALAAAMRLAHEERKDCWSVLIKERGWSKVAATHLKVYEEILA